MGWEEVFRKCGGGGRGNLCMGSTMKKSGVSKTQEKSGEAGEGEGKDD